MKKCSLSFFFFTTLAPFVMASDGSILVFEEADFSALAQSPASPDFFIQEGNAGFDRFVVYYTEKARAFTPADRLCWQAYLPKMPLESEAPTVQYFSITFQGTQLEAPLVRFTADLQPHDLAVPHTVILSVSELRAHKDALGRHLAHDPEHRIHVVLGDGPFIDSARLTMKKDDLPAGLRHLVLSDPEHLVKIINRAFLTGHENLTTFDPLGLEQLHVIEMGFFFKCHRLTKVNMERFFNLEEINVFFLGFCEAFPPEEVEKVRSFIKRKNITH